MAYYSFLLLTLSLVYNFLFCATAAMFTGMESGFTAWLMAMVYMITGVPGAFYLWYKRLYSAAKNDSAMNYSRYFVVYLFHIAFCAYAFIAPPARFPRRRIRSRAPCPRRLRWKRTRNGRGVRIRRVPIRPTLLCP